MDYALVGKIIGTFGIKGEVKVKSETSFADTRFKPGSKLLLKVNDKYLDVEIKSHRTHKNMELVSFSKIGSKILNADINEIESYVGCEIYVDHSSLDELDEGEFYYSDLIGLLVYDTNNNYIGEVIEIRELPRGILLEVKTEKKNALIPFVDEFIDEVNLEENAIYINVIEGLI